MELYKPFKYSVETVILMNTLQVASYVMQNSMKLVQAPPRFAVCWLAANCSKTKAVKYN